MICRCFSDRDNAKIWRNENRGFSPLASLRTHARRMETASVFRDIEEEKTKKTIIAALAAIHRGRGLGWIGLNNLSISVSATAG
jgi:hypothetical protein